MIRKLMITIICIVFASPVLADVSLVNENEVNDVEVSYKFCTSSPTLTCSGISTALVKTDKDHRVVNIPVPPDSQAVLMVSAVEKDSSGKIIAQGKYEIGENSHCGYPLSIQNIKNNVVVSFSDMRQTPIIRCLAKGY